MAENSRQMLALNANDSTLSDDRSFCQMINEAKLHYPISSQSYKNTEEEVVNTDNDEIYNQCNPYKKGFDGKVKTLSKQPQLRKISNLKVTPINENYDSEIMALEEMVYNEKNEVMLTKQQVFDLENLGVDYISKSFHDKRDSPIKNLHLNTQNISQRETQECIFISILQYTLESYNINTNIKAEEVYQMLNPEQVQMLKENLEKQLISSFENKNSHCLQSQNTKRESTQDKLNNSLTFDLGHYPLTPWLNKVNNENQSQMKIEDIKDLNFFLPPKQRDDLFVVRYAECSPLFEVNFYTRKAPLLKNSEMQIEEFENSIARINQAIKPFKTQSSFYERLIMFYLVLGLLFVGTISIVLGIMLNFVISIVISILYFIGFILLIVKVRKISNDLLKRVHFNLSLAIRNENDRTYSKFGIKARPGYLSKWIEFHWANPYAPAIP